MDEEIKLRLSATQKQLIEQAAAHCVERRGTGNLSDWVRQALIQAARRELGPVKDGD
jgi:uncharacterized protein (DUF1778 family)